MHAYLDIPDHGDDHADPAYSPHVALYLSRAYRDVESQSYQRATRTLTSVLNAQMSIVQRLRVLRVLSICAHAENRFDAAVNYINEALDLASHTSDLLVYCDLGSIGAIASHDWQRFDLAADYYGIALDAFQTARTETPPDNRSRTDAVDTVTRECSLLTSLGIEAFVLADYEQARQHLAAASQSLRTLARATPYQKKVEGRIRWINACVARWIGQVRLAQQEATAALTLYKVGGNDIEIGRLHIVVTDTFLDVVAPLGAPQSAHATPTGTRTKALDRAAPHLLHALAIAHATEDTAGEGLAILAHARYLCASGAYYHAMTRISEVEGVALKLSDYPLMAQALTLRGDAYAGLGEMEQATTCYHLALDALAASHAPAYGKWPLRAILTRQEWTVSASE